MSTLRRDPMPLRGRTALVTGAGRRGGIGHATACRLAAYGASVVVAHFAPHDATQTWGADDVDAAVEEVRGHLATEDAVVAGLHADLADPAEPQRVVDAARDLAGPLDLLVANQALSGSDGPLGELGEELDRHWAVDARASILLAQAYANAHDDTRPGGAIVMMTSGQAQGPMPGEVAYAAAKAAVAGITLTLADQLADRRIRVNTVNPGPVDTGYLGAEAFRAMAEMFPFGRFGEPDDPARLIAWLCTDEAYWITGQVIDSEGGFARHRNGWRP
ncbi:SDR family oxidoreductase [Pseudonocardia parietis]|uniref:3-oxoacyl-[acyl-carrier protein] reductase n=1 Tax=Pseudonocardia parietis TaxID=570936 RepID=A0ABS4VTF9_9PSEU|nr:SDR family oxidoreductase [Pseudonocardia parietis]MBP2367220.1 3-oxoacyl-[acyl-carrier protein] reductase [Pseudonocardia parietis]